MKRLLKAIAIVVSTALGAIMFPGAITPAAAATPTTPLSPTVLVEVSIFSHGEPSRATAAYSFVCDNGFSIGGELAWGGRAAHQLPRYAYCTLYTSPAERRSFIADLRAGTVNRNHDYLFQVVDGAAFYVTQYSASAYTDLDLFIIEQFNAILHRDPTEAELDQWVFTISRGEAPSEAIATSLLKSNEFASKVRPVSRLYLAYFDRWSDRPGERYWVNLTQGGLHLDRIAEQFALSAEFRQAYGPLDNQDFVGLVYKNVMDRRADAGGLAYWTALLDGGAFTRGEMMTQFSESVEYRSLTDGNITVRSLVVGELEIEPPLDVMKAEAAQWKAGDDLSSLVAELLDSDTYFFKFLWTSTSAAALRVEPTASLNAPGSSVASSPPHEFSAQPLLMLGDELGASSGMSFER